MVQRVARFVVGRRTKFVVLLFWLVAVSVAGPLAGKLSGAERNDEQSWLPGDAESTQVLREEAAFESPNLMPAVVVFERQDGLSAADRAAITADAGRLRTVVHLDGPVEGPLYAADGRAAVLVAPVDLGANGWQVAGAAVARIDGVVRGVPGLSAHVTGQAGYAAASSNAFSGIDGTLLYSALLVVVLILLLTYRSPVLWLLPVVSAAVALASAEGVIDLLARHAGLTVNALSAGILTVLVFGAGTDYALLLVARYREELRRHQDRHNAMAVALRRAGPAIVASAGTVTLGLLCLMLAETNSTSGLGPVAAIGVAVGLLSMLTLLPALLVTVGPWVFWPRRPRFGSPDPTATGPWARVGACIARRPRPVWIGTVAVLGVMALGVTTLHASGLSDSQSYRGRPDAVVGEAVLSRHFPAGEGSPVVVVARAAETAAVERAFAAVPGIAGLSPPETAGGEVLLQGTLRPAPDTPAAYRVIDEVRAAVHGVAGAGAEVGGATAVNLDVERAAAHDRDLVIPVVLLVVFVILALLLRALLAPLVLIATVVLSLLASLGLSAEVFTHVFGFAGADAAFPLYVFVFLVALGIDYNIFLMSRVREESVRRGTTLGALVALAATGGVITSAGFVLAGTFAVLATLPLTTFVEIGFTVAFGVLLDTVVVRSVLVTALNLELGEAIWWPSHVWRPDLAAPGPAEAALSSRRGR